MAMDNSEQKAKFNLVYALSLGMSLGLFVAVPLVVFLVLGVIIDRKLGTTPLFIIILILLSFLVAGIQVKKLILPFLEKRSRKIDSNNK